METPIYVPVHLPSNGVGDTQQIPAFPSTEAVATVEKLVGFNGLGHRHSLKTIISKHMYNSLILISIVVM